MKALPKQLVAVLALGLAVAAVFGLWSTTASAESVVGYVDRDYVIEAYAGAQIAAVIQERDRLQREFDEVSQDLDEAEKQALFEEYEARLIAYEQEVGIAALMQNIEDALQAVAEEYGVTVIVDHSVIIFGGIDLTAAVLNHLSSQGN